MVNICFVVRVLFLVSSPGPHVETNLGKISQNQLICWVGMQLVHGSLVPIETHEQMAICSFHLSAKETFDLPPFLSSTA